MAFRIAAKRSPFIKVFNVSLVSNASLHTDNLRIIEKTSLSDNKRGTGYRSSFNGVVCTVFGASGFVGRNVVNRLGKFGTQIVIPHRCSWDDIIGLRTSADLGQMQFCDFALENEDLIRRAVKYSDVVINLVGRDYDTMNYSIEKVNIDGARRIAKICREMGVKKLIHVSSISASPNPPELVIKGGSRFLKSKWYGEQAVREEFPDAVIVRPSDIYGHLDRFFTYIGSPHRVLFKKLFLYNKGLSTIKQPVYIGDVCSGFAELVKRSPKEDAGKIYQFVGPRRYVLRDLMQYLFFHMEKDEEYFNLTIEDSRFSTQFWLWFTYWDKVYLVDPYDGICWERFERENLTDIFDETLPHLRDLGVQLNKIEQHVWGISRIFKAFKDCELEVSQFQQPPDPPLVQEI